MDPQAKETYKLWHKEDVRYTDLDALGHVSSVKFHEYLANARTRLFKEHISGWPKANIVPMLKKAEIEYMDEVFFPATLETGLSVSKIGNSSFELTLAIFLDDICKAVAKNLFVFVDRDVKRSTPIPDDVKQAFKPYAMEGA